MPWSSSDRKSELPHDWDTVRKRVLDRDGHACQWPRAGRRGGICGASAHEVDHRVHRDDHRDESLWALCHWHHNRKTQDESTAGKQALAAKLRHPVDKHPGLR